MAAPAELDRRAREVLKALVQDYIQTGDPVASHVRFKAKYELNFPLLSDEDGAVCEKYGVWVEKSMYGRKYMGIERTTFLIDEEGRIAKIFPKVKVDGHCAEVLEAL